MFGHDKDDKKDDDEIVQPAASAPPSSALLGIDDDDDDQVVTGQPSGAVDAPQSTAGTVNAPTSAADDNLLSIKREALQELSPLVHQLDQSPEEKFETLMMMIQASDNQTLIPEAFTAAKGIKDDKKRARALLDVVNEINYFTKKA